MTVYVKSQQGEWLMPTHPAKARWLVRNGKAKVVQRTPFANDALVIAQAGIMPAEVLIKTICLGGRKRSLHEATPRKGRTPPNREQRRNGKNVLSLKGFKRLDTVMYQGQVGYISGFNGTSMGFVRGEEGRYITTPGKSYQQVPLAQCQFVHHNPTRVHFWVKVPKTAPPSSRASLACAR